MTGTGSRFKIVVGVLLTTIIFTQPVSASGGATGWSNCNWAWKEGASNPNLTFQSDGSFPPDVVRDGVVNSFTARMADSVGEWNRIMNTRLALRGDFIRVASGGNVVARYQTIDPSALGVVFLDGQTVTLDACPPHGLNLNSNFSATVYISVRSDWFTQDDSRRALWEACPTQGGPQYTCSKQFDFGSTLVHELGHAIGFIHHPIAVELFHDAGSGASAAADCDNPLDQASMCTPLDDHRTHFRTLHDWDVESLRQIHQRF